MEKFIDLEYVELLRAKIDRLQAKIDRVNAHTTQQYLYVDHLLRRVCVLQRRINQIFRNARQLCGVS